MTNLEEIKRRMDAIAMNPQPSELHLLYRADVNILLSEVVRLKGLLKKMYHYSDISKCYFDACEKKHGGIEDDEISVELAAANKKYEGKE